jgi:hypothetical protein
MTPVCVETVTLGGAVCVGSIDSGPCLKGEIKYMGCCMPVKRACEALPSDCPGEVNCACAVGPICNPAGGSTVMNNSCYSWMGDTVICVDNTGFVTPGGK